MTPSNPYPDRHNTEGMSDDADNGTSKQKLEEDARGAKREAGAQAREQAEAGQHRIADEADALSDAIDAAASNLDDDDREGLARYARDLSRHLSSAAEQLENRSVDELASDAKRLARNNPALFMLGSISVGFGLSRFFKANAERSNQDHDQADRNTDRTREDDIWAGMPAHRRESDVTGTNISTATPHNGHGSDMP